jgi:DNA-directed RNA polymerase subunit RPC12/RpoP
MEELVCKNCGANALMRKNNYMVCPYCDSRFVITREEHCSGLFDSNRYASPSYSGVQSSEQYHSGLFGSGHHTTLSHRDVQSSIALDNDVTRLLEKCRTEPWNARKYANLVLDIDPHNREALKYLRK